MRQNIIAATLVAATMAVAATSCGIYKKYQTPSNTPLTAQYVEARQQAVDSTALGNLLWEEVFTDPVLADLIDRALAANTTLANARLNIDIAQAQLRGAKLAYLPSVTLAPNGSGNHVGGVPSESTISWTYQIPAVVSWEVDLFGKLLNNKRSAAVAVEQSEAYAQAVRSQIIATVANTYYSMAAVEAQLKVARNTAKLWGESVQVMKDLKDAGKSGMTEAGVVQASANLQSVLAQITSLEDTRKVLDNSMSLLLETMPTHWEVSPDATLEIPAPIIQGVPMSYLAMRPDVTAAERSLAIAYYTTASARAAFYPSLSISFTGGFTNQLGTMIKNPGEWFYNLAGSLTAPLFARGQNIARLQAAKAQQTQAMNNFEHTLLSAASEVSNAMSAYTTAGRQAAIYDAQTADLEKAVEYTNDLMIYANGTYLEVLTAQQSLLSAQLNRISSSLARSQAIISLYQSIGGGR